MGKTLARLLEADFDVVLARKLCASGNPEIAVGAIDETGWSMLTPSAAALGADAAYLDAERARQLKLLQARRAKYAPLHTPIDPAGRAVIVVDDGVATGSTMTAALRSVRRHHPSRLICAVPVASPDALPAIQALADEVVCLEAPGNFIAVSQFYSDFPQIDDEDVARLLRM